MRAVAVLSVVAFHAFPAWVPGGFVGVDVFFVISGFLISTIILGGLDQGQFTFRGFYARRIRRIFPALAVVLIACYSFGWFALLADEYKQLGHHMAAGSAFVSNFLLWSEAGYFDAAADAKPLLHLWSLGIEEQFYLLWPLILYVAWKLKVNRLLVTLALGAASFGLCVALSAQHRVADFYSPVTRFWELSLGSALAYLALYGHVRLDGGIRAGRDKFWCNIKAATGATLLTVSLFAFTRNSVFPGWLALLPTVGAYCLIWAGPDAWLNKKILSHPLLVAVGLVSFPFYLWHWPLLSFLRIVGSGQAPGALRAGAVVASLALAWLTYRLLERPVRFGRHRLASVVVLSCVMLFLGVVGQETFRRDGFGFRLQAFEEQLAVIKTVVESSPECQASVRISGLRYCLIADAARPATVALFGDSHANRLFTALKTRYEAMGENLLSIGGAGCLPFWDIETGRPGEPYHCDQKMNPQLDYLLHSSTIKKIILVHRGAIHITGVDLVSSNSFSLQNTKTLQSGKSREEVYQAALVETLQRLTNAGKEVDVVIDAPEFSYETTLCMDLVRPFASPFVSRPDCRIRREEVNARNRRYLQISEEAVRQVPHTRLVNPQDVLCDEKFCYAIRDGKLLYRDADHLNRYGAEYVVSRLWNQF